MKFWTGYILQRRKWPVFPISVDLGEVHTPADLVFWTIGYVLDPVINCSHPVPEGTTATLSRIMLQVLGMILLTGDNVRLTESFPPTD